MLRVGLTGGIASGKSRVLQRFVRQGFHTLDLDRVAHDLMAPGGASHADVVAAFGQEVLGPDGSIDRKRLGARVFADAAARATLNALVHPRVRDAEARWAAALPAGEGAVAVVDAALLVESGLHLRFDRLVVAHCGPEEQVRRLMIRDGIEETAARARLAAQMPPEEKRRFAHLVVDTSGAVDDTDRQADLLAGTLRDLAGRPPVPVTVPLDRALGGLFGASSPTDGPAPLDVLRELALKGMEMPALAALRRPAAVPWYRPRPPGPDEAAPAELALPVVLWALGRRGGDEPFLMGALLSLAACFDPRRGAAATTVLVGLALAEVARTGVWPEASTVEAWAAQARHRANEDPSPDARRALEATPEARGQDRVAAILAGLLTGRPPASSPREAVDALRRLG